MNRVLYISIPLPDLEELIQTAQKISESYNYHLAQIYKDLFKTLAITYHSYKEGLILKYSKEKDFYHLIKTAMKSLLKKSLNEKK